MPMSNDTLTLKTHELTALEVKDIFENYGRVINISEFRNRYFIQFETPGEADLAYSALKKIYGVAYAHKKTSARPQRNNLGENRNNRREPPGAIPRLQYKVQRERSDQRIVDYLDRVLEKKECGVGFFQPSYKTNTEPKKNSRSTMGQCEVEPPESPIPSTSKWGEPLHETSASSGSEDYNEPSASDNEELPAMDHSIILANIPERYTLDDVFYLVEEVSPVAFTEMDYSLRLRIKFCEVFVSSAADAEYLKKKLNDFVICGQQLTVVEPASIDRFEWNP